MDLCKKCQGFVQSAAKKSIAKKRAEMAKKLGENSEELKTIKTDPFVVMWVPAPPEKKSTEEDEYYPPDPNCLEYDYTIDMATGSAECAMRLYPKVK